MAPCRCNFSTMSSLSFAACVISIFLVATYASYSTTLLPIVSIKTPHTSNFDSAIEARNKLSRRLDPRLLPTFLEYFRRRKHWHDFAVFRWSSIRLRPIKCNLLIYILQIVSWVTLEFYQKVIPFNVAISGLIKISEKRTRNLKEKFEMYFPEIRFPFDFHSIVLCAQLRDCS